MHCRKNALNFQVPKKYERKNGYTPNIPTYLQNMDLNTDIPTYSALVPTDENNETKPLAD